MLSLLSSGTVLGLVLHGFFMFFCARLSVYRPRPHADLFVVEQLARKRPLSRAIRMATGFAYKN